MSDSSKPATQKRKRRKRTTFPFTTFEDALNLADAIQEHGAGQPIRRLTLFEALDRSPNSSTSRDLITNSRRYGITLGHYRAEILELTEDGKKATGLNILLNLI